MLGEAKAGSVAAGTTETKLAATVPEGALSTTSTRRLHAGVNRTRFKVKQADFSWQHVSVRVPSGSKEGDGMKLILDDVSGHVAPGEVVAVMGPSGCGKTTLLNALAGKLLGSKVVTTGKILVDGAKRDALFKRKVSYVPQENSLMGVLTVRESMKFAAELAGATGQQVDDMAADTLHELGMDDCADTRVGDIFFKGISGGQQRRLSIGVELLKQPSIIMLDEPTSGLDSAAAFGVMQSIRDLAVAGRAVLATIHQPSADVLHMFDRVILLSRGRVMYFGPTDEMADYFASLGYPCPMLQNPADHVMNLVNSDFPGHADLEQLYAAYKERQYPGIVAVAEALDEGHPRFTGHARASLRDGDEAVQLATFSHREGKEFAVNQWKQFTVLARRSFLNNLRNPGVFWIRMLMYTMLALMIGLLYLGQDTSNPTIQDRFALLFFSSSFMAFMSIAALPFLISNRAVFMRERSNGAYAILPYVTSTFVTAVPGLAVISIVSSVLIYFMAELRSGGYGVFVVDLFLTLTIAESFTLCVASLVPHYILGIAISAAIYGCHMLTEGFIMQLSRIPDYLVWLYHIGFLTYSFRVFTFNEFDGLTFECSAATLSLLAPDEQCSLEGEQILAQLDMEDVDVDRDLGILAAFVVLYQLFFFAILYFKYPSVVPDVQETYVPKRTAGTKVLTSSSTVPTATTGDAPAPAAGAAAATAADAGNGDGAANSMSAV